MIVRQLVFAALSTGLLVASPIVAAGDNHEKQATADPSGTWRWEDDAEGKTAQNVLTINFDGKKTVTGRFQRDDEPSVEIEDAEMNGAELSFGLMFTTPDGIPVEIFFMGEVDGNEIDGIVEFIIEEYEVDEEAPWKAQRWLEATDVVGTWKFKIVLPDGGVLEPQIEFSVADDKQALQATHVGSSMKVSDIAIKDKESLVFTVSGDFNGQDVVAYYSVEPRGDKLTGSLKYELSGDVGELDVSGVREVEDEKSGD